MWLMMSAFVLASVAGGVIAQEGVLQSDEEIGPAGLGEGVGADAVEFVPAPPLSQSVLRLVESELLSESARSERRLFHGLWRASDLDVAEARAGVMLVSGAWFHPVFEDAEVPAWMRGRALLERGEVTRALGVVGGEVDTASVLVRAEALYALGRYAESARVAESIGGLLDGVGSASETTLSASEIVDCVRALLLRARVSGVGGEPEDEYARLLSILTSVHQVRDRLYWPAMLAEAELLVERGARSDGVAALQQVLSLHPRNARAWALLGGMYVDGFDLARAMGVAQQLDRLVGSAWRESGAEATSDQVSVDASLIRARRWVRQSDYEFASDALEGALRVAGGSPSVLAASAGVAALSYDDALIEAAVSAYESVAPGGAMAHAAVGKTLSDRRQYALSSVYLREAASRLSNWSAPWTELGLLELQAGRIGEGLDALDRALELDPFHTRASNTRVMARELLAYEVIETEHFVVRHAGGSDRVLAEEMARVAEEVHARLSAELGYEPVVKTSLDLMPDHERFAVRVTGMPGVFTVAACTGPVVAMESPRAGKLNTGAYDWERVFVHEYAHTLTLGMTENRIPHWLTEAFSVRSEEAPRPYGWWRLLSEAAIAGRTYSIENMSLGFIRPESPEDRTRAYAQSEFVLEYVIERFGADAPAELLGVFREGITEREAWDRVLGVSVETFDRDFGVWAEERFAEVGLRVVRSVDDIAIEAGFQDAGGAQVLRGRLSLMASGLALRIAGGGLGGEEGWGGFERSAVTEENVERWLALYPEHPDLLELASRNAVQRSGGVADLSHVELLERYLESRPIDDWPHLQLLRVYRDAEQPLLAARHLAWLDAREVNSPVYASALARIRAGESDWAGALSDAVRASRKEPFDPEHREVVAEVALRLGAFSVAREALEALIAIEPDRAVHVRRLAALERLAGAAQGE